MTTLWFWNNSLCLTMPFVAIPIVFEVSILQTTPVPLDCTHSSCFCGSADHSWMLEALGRLSHTEFREKTQAHHEWAPQPAKELGFLLRSSFLSPLFWLVFFTEGHYQTFLISGGHCLLILCLELVFCSSNTICCLQQTAG